MSGRLLKEIAEAGGRTPPKAVKQLVVDDDDSSVIEKRLSAAAQKVAKQADDVDGFDIGIWKPRPPRRR